MLFRRAHNHERTKMSKTKVIYETKNNTPAPIKCACGCNQFSFLGVQEATDFDLKLFNCVYCGTTLAVRIKKEVSTWEI